MWRKTMLYLGLGPDDEYEDDVEMGEPAPAPPVARDTAPPARPTPARPRPSARPASARPSTVGVPASPVPVEDTSAVRTLPGPGPGEATLKPRTVVRPVPAAASAKAHVVVPSSFNQAQDVADRFKANQPVILNLQGTDRELARRLIDFSSGLCYGLGGHMEKVAHQVYLLTPTNVEVSPEERRRLQERGLHDG
jgi:cell division inhibitor SepF